MAGPGFYCITCGDCLAHIGTSGKLGQRLRALARLGAHRGSAEVLCAAFCTGQPPMVWWEPHATKQSAEVREASFKTYYREPPVPRSRYEACRNGLALRAAMLKAAESDLWAAGYIEAVFDIGENLHLLFRQRFEGLWQQVGMPPGPYHLRQGTAS